MGSASIAVVPQAVKISRIIDTYELEFWLSFISSIDDSYRQKLCFPAYWISLHTTDFFTT
jgi:hypothetical protein